MRRLTGQELEVVQTSLGPVTVTVSGNRNRPSLITYHDIGLNHSTCFQGMFMGAEPSSLLLTNFCVYHIDAPGHEAGASEIHFTETELSAFDLSEQVAEIVQHFSLKRVICLGVGAGAYILTLLAISHPSMVQGLILVSPVCQPATWMEWVSSKLSINMLSFYGMSTSVKEGFLARFFSDGESGYHGPGSDSLFSFCKELEAREPSNVARYAQAFLSRVDLVPDLRKFKCPTLIVVGEHSPFYDKSLDMYLNMDPLLTSWFQVPASSSLVTVERPHMLQSPLESFLQKLGHYRRPPSFSELRALSPPSPPGFRAEEFSPKACGVNLKPIRTRTEKIENAE